MDKQIIIDTDGLNGYKLEIPADQMMTESRLNEQFKMMNEELKKYSQGSSKSDKMSCMIDSYNDDWYFNNNLMNNPYVFIPSGETDVIKSQVVGHEVKKRDYDTPVNKWELSIPSKETRLKNRKKRKSKK